MRVGPIGKETSDRTKPSAMKKALSTILVVATLCEETPNAASWFPFDLDVVHSLRRHYPDQVLGVDGDSTVLSAGLPQLPRYLRREMSDRVKFSFNSERSGRTLLKGD
jgi:hypothetical protein